MRLRYVLTIDLIGAHKPVNADDTQHTIETAVSDAILRKLDPEDLDVDLEEA